MIKVSIGTASVLHLNHTKPKTEPTTAYFMIGEKCLNHCLFCSQASDNEASTNLLSRVAWSSYSKEKVFNKLYSAYKTKKIKRACLQVVHNTDSLEKILDAIESIRKYTPIPICASASLNQFHDVEKILHKGADKVCLALDASTPDLYSKIKGGNFNSKLELILKLAKHFPTRITTHLIAGLGETQEEMITLINKLLTYKITIALFAFTPIKYTPLENTPRPTISSYRKLQLALFLLKYKFVELNDLSFENGELIDINLPQKKLFSLIKQNKGEVFRTTGCSDCNRPYYNESPLGPIYNYPYELSTNEIYNAFFETKLEIADPDFLNKKSSKKSAVTV